MLLLHILRLIWGYAKVEYEYYFSADWLGFTECLGG